MKILYLCDKKIYETKMSRVRFDGMKAVSDLADVIWSGLGWDNYKENISVDENINLIYGDDKPDIIIAYKPEGLIGFAETKIPTCLRYNEMWPVKEFSEELTSNNVDLVIAHHLNDIPKYKHLQNITFKHVPHSAEASIFKDYGLEKKYDILFTGAVSRRHYPFRARLKHLLRNQWSDKFNCKILEHPGGRLNLLRNGASIGKNYAKEINQAKICISCSSAYKYRLGKYVEIPMCGTILAGDLPDQDQDQFKDFMLVLNVSDSDEQIFSKIQTLLSDQDIMNEKVRKGLEWSQNYTQTRYAERLLKEIGDYLNEKNSISN